MTIRRVNHGTSHSYVDVDTGEKIPGVTRFTDEGIPKKALEKWLVDVTVNYAIDHWDELSRLPVSDRIKRMHGARYESTGQAKARGTKVHKLGEQLVAGKRVKIPEGLEGYVSSYVRFLDEWDVRPVLVEVPVVNHHHRYCGTLDLAAYLIDPDDPDPDGGSLLWLLDLTTAASGVWGEKALQVAGYRYADAYIGDDGNEYELPGFERFGAVHIRPDGYSLVPLDAGELSHRRLLYAQQIRQYTQESRTLVGEPLDPPHTSTWRLQQSPGVRPVCMIPDCGCTGEAHP